MIKSQYFQESGWSFVLKNFMPEKHKVILLHQKLGKITCVFTKYDRAARLCTGAQIVCVLEKKQNWYEILHYDIVFMPEKLEVSTLTFIHNVIELCLKLLPAHIAVGELFDFLSYVYQYFDTLTLQAQKVVLLRLFLLFDLLPEDKVMYRCALQDPYGLIKQTDQDLTRYIALCWQRFYHEVEQ